VEPNAPPEVLFSRLGVALMNCSEFLELYSDYRDGRLEDAGVARAVRQHLSECDSCMRYDAVICRGVMALRAEDELEPSKPIILPGLFVLPDSAEHPAHSPAKYAAALMVAAAIALFVWPRADIPESPPELAQVAPEPAHQVEVLQKPQPLPVREIDPGPRVVHATLQPPPDQSSYVEWVALPD